MKPKPLFLALAALLAAGGLWFAGSAWRAHTFHTSSVGAGPDTASHGPSNPPQMRRPVAPGKDIGPEMPDGRPEAGQMQYPPARLAPPIPNRRFTDFTPEQRVEFARRGHGPGG